MLIIPAIDLQDGCVVRFTQGLRDKKVYSRDPVKTARHWVKQGAQLLHVVDLDGAMTGRPKNMQVVKAIAGAVRIPLEFGGGVRSIEAVREALATGATRVVLGTKAIEDRGFLKKAFARFGEKVIVSIDARAGKVMTKGWKSRSGLSALDFALLLKQAGFSEAIFTDVAKDGTLKGPSIMEAKRLLKSSGMRLIASGGVSSLDDLRRLEALCGQGLIGVIVGKALYEGRFTLKEALNFIG